MKTGKYAVLAMIIFLAVLGFSACLGGGGGQTAGTGQEADTVIGNGRQSLENSVRFGESGAGTDS